MDGGRLEADNGVATWGHENEIRDSAPWTSLPEPALCIHTAGLWLVLYSSGHARYLQFSCATKPLLVAAPVPTNC